MLLSFILEGHYELLLLATVLFEGLDVFALGDYRLDQLLYVVLHGRLLDLALLATHKLVNQLLADEVLLVIPVADRADMGLADLRLDQSVLRRLVDDVHPRFFVEVPLLDGDFLGCEAVQRRLRVSIG